ncbi:MAG: hypothetical protein DRG83_00330 [Deltaproteobacteria bacterium]|nr:MAG: hypothetical protein DRG83_00330 [Deltaproteobacteria bacterium]
MTLARLKEILDYYSKILNPDEVEVQIYCPPTFFPEGSYEPIRTVVLRTRVEGKEEKISLALAN